jgi:hypothetical protein
VKVVRAVVHGRVETVKTEYSEDELPLDPDFAAILLGWKRECEVWVRKALDEGTTPLAGLDLVFTSPATGRHFHTAPVQQDYIRPLAAVWWRTQRSLDTSIYKLRLRHIRDPGDAHARKRSHSNRECHGNRSIG